MTRRPRGAYERALAFCRAHRLFRPGDRVLVGSGSGAASLGVLGFLLLAQRDLGLAAIAVGAIDFGGEDDAEAVADAGRFARQLGTDFYAVSAEGCSATAALVALARREGFTRVALGHTRDDAVSRVLSQLVRGGGLDRILPYAARRPDGVVRPLLDLRDAEALELARTAGIEPVMLPPEPSARPPLATRLRASVLPRLRVEAPGADEALLALGRDVRRLVKGVRAEARRQIEAGTLANGALELPWVGANPLLATALANAAVARLDVSPATARSSAHALARLLRSPDRALNSREVVLGPGLVATYLPARRVVAIRVRRARRASEGGIG
jgi:tRNA(Ile)-lysidine synthase TilS/MesJ